MATLDQIHALSEDETFRRRICSACVHQALTSGKLAPASKRVISDMIGYIDSFAKACADDATIQAAAYAGGSLNASAILDADIQNAVQNVWPQLVYR